MVDIRVSIYSVQLIQTISMGLDESLRYSMLFIEIHKEWMTERTYLNTSCLINRQLENQYTRLRKEEDAPLAKFTHTSFF